MKRLRCKSYLGIWYYNKIMPNDYNDLDAPIYELYDQDKNFVGNAGSYGEMFYYVQYGEWC